MKITNGTSQRGGIKKKFVIIALILLNLCGCAGVERKCGCIVAEDEAVEIGFEPTRGHDIDQLKHRIPTEKYIFRSDIPKDPETGEIISVLSAITVAFVSGWAIMSQPVPQGNYGELNIMLYLFEAITISPILGAGTYFFTKAVSDSIACESNKDYINSKAFYK